MADVVVCDSLVLRIVDGFVVVVTLRVEADDVPGVDEAGDVA